MTFTRQELMADAKQQLTAFFDSPYRNSWVQCHIGEIYVRKGTRHHFHGMAHNTFDVANINLHPRYRGVGIMHELLEWINFAHKAEYTFIESIQNDGFYESLIAQGWTCADEDRGRMVVKKKVHFDITAYTFEAVQIDAHSWSGTIKEFPQFKLYEGSERAVRRELLRFIEEMIIMELAND